MYYQSIVKINIMYAYKYEFYETNYFKLYNFNPLMQFFFFTFKRKIIINLYLLVLKMFISRYKFKSFTLINLFLYTQNDS